VDSFFRVRPIADADGDTAGSSPNSFARNYRSSVPLERETGLVTRCSFPEGSPVASLKPWLQPVLASSAGASDYRFAPNAVLRLSRPSQFHR